MAYVLRKMQISLVNNSRIPRIKNAKFSFILLIRILFSIFYMKYLFTNTQKQKNLLKNGLRFKKNANFTCK